MTLDEQLISAVKSENIKEVKSLLDKGADVEAKDKWDNTPLLLAAKKGHTEVVTLLINKGANVEAKDNGDNTPLHLAAKGGYLEIVKRLIDKGADVNAKNNYNFTPLHCAAKHGRLNIVIYFMNNYNNLSAEKDKDGDTPLHLAALYGKLDVVKKLIGKGADISAKNNDNETPLNLATKKGYSSIVNTLTLVSSHRSKRHITEDSKIMAVSSGNAKSSILGTVISTAVWSVVKVVGFVKESVNGVKGMISGVFTQDGDNLSNTRGNLQKSFVENSFNGNHKVAVYPKRIPDMENKIGKISWNNEQQKHYGTKQSIHSELADVNSTLLLADAMIRNKTKEHYKQPIDDSLLPPIEQSKKVNFPDGRLKVIENALNPNANIPISNVEEQLKKTEEWINNAELLNISKPATWLNNVSITGNLTKVVGV